MSREKILKCASGTLNNIELEICAGSVLDLEVDTIANAANERLENKGGLAYQIVHDGGREIQEDCDRYIKTYGDLRTGSVAITIAGKLRYQKILHVVGPRLKDHKPVKFDHKDDLVKAVFNCMVKADEEGFSSIGIPAISCGIFSFPIEEASLCHIEAFICYAGMYVRSNPNAFLRKVIFSLFNKNELDWFLKAFMEKWQGFDFVMYLGNRDTQNLAKISWICELCDCNFENNLDFLRFSANHDHLFKKKTCDFCIFQYRITNCSICKSSYFDNTSADIFNWILCRECKNWKEERSSRCCRQLCYECLLQRKENEVKTEDEIKCICGAFALKEFQMQNNQYYAYN
ncbi:unnamed protein product [Blepharisma stoltei]|uniref:Macro domain-containing protein n=1 Tax=Blepharisma stoltei TaxID=1481888 RepID=A0AAU9IWL3_9CILI|nr:unnamed protein product [Blepharisma stoltei]